MKLLVVCRSLRYCNSICIYHLRLIKLITLFIIEGILVLEDRYGWSKIGIIRIPSRTGCMSWIHVLI